MSFVLLIFIRNPRLGVVKTRLARTVGDAEALRIYYLLLEKTQQVVLNTDVERWLYYSDFIDPADNWPETRFRKFVQSGGDLGARMENAFRKAFDAGATRVVIIGSDCPELTGEALQQAFEALKNTDFVLGPTPDGGYYLLGMNRFEPAVFQNIAWSTAAVLEETIQKIREIGQRCILLPELPDVDTEEDWRRFTGKTTTSRFP